MLFNYVTKGYHISGATRFWPVIDDALRQVALEKGVEVRVMASWWNHSRPDLPNYLSSLHALSGAMKANIQVVSGNTFFEIPHVFDERW